VLSFLGAILAVIALYRFLRLIDQFEREGTRGALLFALVALLSVLVIETKSRRAAESQDIKKSEQAALPDDVRVNQIGSRRHANLPMGSVQVAWMRRNPPR